MAFNQMQAMNGLSGGMNPGGSGLPMAQPFKQRGGGYEAFFGNRGGFAQTPRFSQNQSQSIEQILQQALGMLNPEAMQQQAVNRFNQQTIPGLAERFTSLGQGRASSPAFASQLGQAGAGLSTDLAAMQSQLGQSLLPLGLTQQNETHYQQGSQGIVQQILSALLGAGGTAAGMHFGTKGLAEALRGLGGKQ